MKEISRLTREFEILLVENRDKESTPDKVVKTLTSWAQETLNVLNKLSLPINGKLDAATVAAIRSFQTQNGLSATGKVDAPTERQLMEQLALAKAGIGKMAEVYGIIQSAKTKIEDWTKRADVTDRKIITNQYRHPDRVWALVLHHMAFKRRDPKKRLYNQPESYVRTLAHFCILFDGRIIQLHPISRLIHHSQCTSQGSVGVEFEGNFPDVKGKWWPNKVYNDKKEWIKTTIDEDHPTAPQIEAGRFLIRYLQVVNNLKTVLAHRQSSMGRADDPGPDVWFNVGEWALKNLGLSDGGPGFFCKGEKDKGQPILESWRTWGEKSVIMPDATTFKQKISYPKRKEMESLLSLPGIQKGQPNHGFSFNNGGSSFLNSLPLPFGLYVNDAELIPIARTWGDSKSVGSKIDELTFKKMGIAATSFTQVSPEEKIKFQKIWAEIRKHLFFLRRSFVKNNTVSPIHKDIIPFGFEKNKYGNITGLKSGAYINNDLCPRLENVLVRLYKEGKIKITQDQLDVFQRIANVESDGKINALNSYDTGIVSLGFMQFTLHVGKIQKWIKLNEPAFKRYGIELDAVNKYFYSYEYKKKKYTSEFNGIKGVPYKNIDNLRWNGWAERFFYAGLDDEIIVAEVELALFYLGHHLISLKNRIKNKSIYDAFMQYYKMDPYVKALFQESFNNNNSRAAKAVVDTVEKLVSSDKSLKEFLKVYTDVLIKSGWESIVKKSSAGATLRIN